MSWWEIVEKWDREHPAAEKSSAPDDDSSFPRCPNMQCHSYFLYRRNNIGDFTCESCGLMGITEARAGAGLVEMNQPETETEFLRFE